MNFICPQCGNKLITEDENLYTCVNCGDLYSIDDLLEEYDIPVSKCAGGSCDLD